MSRLRLGTRSEALGLLWTLAMTLPVAGVVIWLGAPVWLIGAAGGVSYTAEALFHYWRKDHARAKGAGLMAVFWIIVTVLWIAAGL